MSFKQMYRTKGFDLDNNGTRMIHNGTFLDNESFPTLGYKRDYELRDNEYREDYGLPVRRGKATRENEWELSNARTGSDSDGIDFEIVLSTSFDLTAIAPGNLIGTWVENNRNYFHYKMNAPMSNFYSIVSAQYAV